MNQGESAQTLELVCCLGLTDSQAYHYPAPIAAHPLVSRLWLVRSHHSPFGTPPGAEYVLTPRFTPLRLLRMYRESVRLAGREEVRGFISFNPFPYGLLELAAARRFGKLVHFGFIGPDWYWHMHSARRHALLPFVRRAGFVTATGESMRAEIAASGVDPARIAVLPHCIDADRFSVNEPRAAGYSCIYVGKLIRRKRVDVILRGFARVVRKHPEATLCIVGDGPLNGELHRLADRLGISGAVEFAGYVQDVKPYLANAKINVMASVEEGFPFAIVEGICAGVVPVTTPAGTIADLITDGKNGLLFAMGDDAALASCIDRLLEDDAQYSAMREKVLRQRRDFSYDRATAVWDPWIRQLADTTRETAR